MADYLVSEGGSTAQFLTTIVAVSVLLPEISDTCEEWEIILVWQANICIPWLLVQISKKLSMRKMVFFHACFMSLSQGLHVMLQILTLKALYVRWKPWPKIFIASVLKNFVIINSILTIIFVFWKLHSRNCSCWTKWQEGAGSKIVSYQVFKLHVITKWDLTFFYHKHFKQHAAIHADCQIQHPAAPDFADSSRIWLTSVTSQFCWVWVKWCRRVMAAFPSLAVCESRNSVGQQGGRICVGCFSGGGRE